MADQLIQRTEAQNRVKYAGGILDLDFGGGNDVRVLVNHVPPRHFPMLPVADVECPGGPEHADSSGVATVALRAALNAPIGLAYMEEGSIIA